jgi:hypothetical protein
MRDDATELKAEQPFQPEFPISRFARGMIEHEPRPEEMYLGRFSEGQETGEHGPLHRGRFSEGQEVLGDEDPEKHIRRRYSEGLEHRVVA